MTHESRTPAFDATLDCRAVESLLPVLDEPTLAPSDAAHVRQHVAGCAHCRAMLDDYQRLDALLRRLDAAPRHRTEEIMSQLEVEHESDEAVARGIEAVLPALTPRHRPRRRTLSAIASVAAVLVVAALLSGLLLRLRPLGQAAPTTRATPTPLAAESALTDLAMVSPTEGWAVGTVSRTNRAGGIAYSALVAHLANGVWTSTELPYAGRLATISMDSPVDGWAGGDLGAMLHFDGHRWAPVALPAGAAMILRVQALSPSDAWAVDVSQNGVLHYDGHAWAYQPLPVGLLSGDASQTFALQSVAMRSTGEGWAVGTITPATDPAATTSPPSNSVLLHYTGGVWRVDATIPNSNLLSLCVLPDGRVLAAGYSVLDLGTITWGVRGQRYTSDRPLVMARTASGWQRDDAPLLAAQADPASIQVAIFASSTQPWLIAGTDDRTSMVRLLHLGPAGWSRMSLPTVPGIRDSSLGRVIAVSPSESWAVGETLACRDGDMSGPCTADARTLILHEIDGVWSIVASW